MNVVLFIKTIIGSFLMGVTDIAYKCKIQSLHNKVLSLFGFSCFPIESDSNYRKKYKLDNPIILKENRVGVYYNAIYPDSENESVAHYSTLNNLCYFRYHDVVISGDSDVVVDIERNCVISDACYNRNKEIVFIDGLLYRDKNNHCLLRTNLKNEHIKIESGIMISGKFSKNYYHELYENLNRLLLVNSSMFPLNIPILIDESVESNKNLKAILEHLKDNRERGVVVLKPRHIYRINNLYTLSHINYLAPHLINYTHSNEFYRYDAEYLRVQRDALLKFKSTKVTPERFFISRANTNHRHFNEDEVYRVLKQYDFVRIAPEQYSFEDQMAMFNNAKWIIGSTGAAISNVIFCSDTCKILCFRSSIIGEEPPIFNTIASVVGAKFWFYKPTKVYKKNNVHSDYRIDPVSFENCLRKIINE